MPYLEVNLKTKKSLKEAVRAGRRLECFNLTTYSMWNFILIKKESLLKCRGDTIGHTLPWTWMKICISVK